MILGRLNHIAIATPSIGDSVALYREVLGAATVHAAFDLPAHGVRVCFVDPVAVEGVAGTQIELIEPLGEDSPIASFLARHPAGGQHHLCYEVADLAEAQTWFADKGVRVLGRPRIGAHGTPMIFLHPGDMGGVLTAIMETPRADDR